MDLQDESCDDDGENAIAPRDKPAGIGEARVPAQVALSRPAIDAEHF
jgi:hypothetical protein